MRLVRCLIAVGLCSVGAFAAGPAAFAAYPPSAGCTVTPASVAPGGTITIACAAGTFSGGTAFTVTITSTPTVIATGTTGANGSLSTTATIPATESAGSHTITVTAGGVSDSVAVTVTSVPTAGTAPLVSSVPVTG
jgi:hypothetical protein